MLFNSFEFIFLFLPAAVGGFALTSRFGSWLSCLWLALCSIAFYAYWNLGFVGLLLASICVNFAMGHAIGAAKPERRNLLLGIGVALNLTLLAATKYLEPTLRALHQRGLISTDFDIHILLPLGISFFTFTQIGYLVDRRDGVGSDLDLVRYFAFVTFFPHLVAGPILHIREVGPQLSDTRSLRLDPRMAAVGVTLFVMGLAKKVLLADPLAQVVAEGFETPEQLGLVTSWFVALGYAAQLYFDFSGYSDMAMGLAALFGVRFPANFNSPFKSRSIIEYWQRWHMSLSRYLNLLLYNPVALAITRWRARTGKGVGPKDRRKPDAFFQMIITPTLFTMFLAGIWHGAGLQFVIFGMLHGIFLVAAHAWRIYGPARRSAEQQGLLHQVWPIALTFCAILVGFVFFRADSAREAFQFLEQMAGARGVGLPDSLFGLVQAFVPGANDLASLHAARNLLDMPTLTLLLVAFGIIWTAPNTLQLLGEYSPATGVVVEPAREWMRWRPNLLWAAAIAITFFVCLLQLRKTTVFLYFQF